MKPLTILITGFGPFPGAPFNPTGPLVKSLARLRLANVTLASHIFPTRYAAVDRDLPMLIARYRPDALLMFGLATTATALRVETLARNALIALPDAGGKTPLQQCIAIGKASAVAMPAPLRDLLRAAQSARVPAVLSNDAGGYLCNYVCWQAAQIVRHKRRPRLAAFIHIPPVEAPLTMAGLTRAGAAILRAFAAAARR
jgi:pyroglutamyl-peptidase